MYSNENEQNTEKHAPKRKNDGAEENGLNTIETDARSKNGKWYSLEKTWNKI